MAFYCCRIENKILNHTYKYWHDWHWLSLQLQHLLLSPSFGTSAKPFCHVMRHARQGLSTCGSSIWNTITFLPPSPPTYSAPFSPPRLSDLKHPSLSRKHLPSSHSWSDFFSMSFCSSSSLHVEQCFPTLVLFTFWTREFCFVGSCCVHCK